MRMITVENLHKSFMIHHLSRTLPALQDVSLHVPEGSFLGIVGKSGSGKSTILKSIYRTYEPQKGKILFQSEAYGTIDLVQATAREVVYLRKHEIGYVSQFLNVMPRTTALELVEQSLLDLGVSRAEATPKAQQALKHFDIDEALWNSYPNMFSGGEKLRLNIACAIVKEPRLLLLDEPTASLDQASKLKVREAIEKLKANGTTLIGIFHDLEFMEGLCDNVFHMEKIQGKELV
ncbi:MULTISPECIES: phosphonate C-P lyase system protein PhnL [Metasolibacillus]|uniref:phosphonate C-P lyase system protein PhnL n=1 Tax=Metasolibacillus TaxID=2703677 RepID=UPI000798F6BE|nr:phosphonate C-P lyase system protein PhnL [Metasolibacillus fluoroglycofenilyticus]KYG89733.1 phosphonate C-P lyase system protein PhnL [[Bacillus] sp. KCTC 13219]